MSTLDADTAPAPNRAFILGIGVTATTLDRAVSIIEQWIERRIQNYVCITGAHGIIEAAAIRGYARFTMRLAW